jgi:hypothetical protein
MQPYNMSTAMRSGMIIMAVLLLGCLFTYKLGRNHPVGQAIAQVVAGGYKQLGLQQYQQESLPQQQTAEFDLGQLRSVKLDQNDPALLPIIRSVLVPPSNLPYKLDTNSESSHGQAQLMRKLFRNKVN